MNRDLVEILGEGLFDFFDSENIEAEQIPEWESSPNIIGQRRPVHIENRTFPIEVIRHHTINDDELLFFPPYALANFYSQTDTEIITYLNNLDEAERSRLLNYYNGDYNIVPEVTGTFLANIVAMDADRVLDVLFAPPFNWRIDNMIEDNPNIFLISIFSHSHKCFRKLLQYYSPTRIYNFTCPLFRERYNTTRGDALLLSILCGNKVASEELIQYYNRNLLLDSHRFSGSIRSENVIRTVGIAAVESGTCLMRHILRYDLDYLLMRLSIYPDFINWTIADKDIFLWAVWEGAIDCVKYLHRHYQINLAVPYRISNNQNFSLLWHAANNDKKLMYIYLLLSGAPVRTDRVLINNIISRFSDFEYYYKFAIYFDRELLDQKLVTRDRRQYMTFRRIFYGGANGKELLKLDLADCDTIIETFKKMYAI